MPTFADLKLDAYRRTGHGSSPASDVSTRIGSYINRWNRKVLSKPLMEPLRRVILTKASVANQATYGIHLQKIRYMTEATTDRRIYEQTLDWYRANYPDPAAFTGTPRDFVPMGITRIHTRPANASEIFIKSTEAADTGTVRVQAIRSDGYPVSLSKALTGTTAVSMSTTITDVIDIIDVRLSAAQTGTVTVHEDSGTGTELSRLVIGQTTPRFLRFALAPTPSAVITYSIDGIADIVDLSNDTDEPFENPDFHDILVDGAVHDEYAARGRAKEALALAVEIEQRIRDLRMSIVEWPDSVEDRARSFEDTVRLPIA